MALLRSTIVVLQLTAVTVVAIRCLVCEKSYSEAECEANAHREPCYEQASLEAFKTFRRVKESLAEPYWNTGYQCYELQVRNGTSKFWRGCTFENLDLCAELREANVSWCYTCKQDYCNSLEFKGGAGGRIGSWGLVVGFLVLVGFVWGRE